MRLIDAEALINELNNSHYPGAPYVDAGISIAIGKVCDAPTIEPERKNGKWIDTDCVWKAISGDISFDIPAKLCSECNKPIAQVMWKNYCPNCGAKMEEEQ